MSELFFNRELFLLATSLYLTVLIGNIFLFLTKSLATAWISRSIFWGLIFAWLLQTYALYERGIGANALPLRNTFEMLQALAWGATFSTAVLRIVWALKVPALIVSGLAFGLSGLSFINPKIWDIVPENLEPSRSPWISLHALFAIVAYGAWLAAALTWIAYLLQDRALRQRKTNRFYLLLPDLSSLDRVAGRMVACGILAAIGSSLVGSLNFPSWENPPLIFVVYKITLFSFLILGNTWLILLRRKNKITGRSFARRGLLLFLAGIILLGGFSCVRNATSSPLPEKENPPSLKIENSKK